MARAYGSLISYIHHYNGLKSVATKWADATHLQEYLILWVYTCCLAYIFIITYILPQLTVIYNVFDFGGSRQVDAFLGLRGVASTHIVATDFNPLTINPKLKMESRRLGPYSHHYWRNRICYVSADQLFFYMARAYGPLISCIYHHNGLRSVATKWADATHLQNI